MTQIPLVSIIVIFFNEEIFIEEAIASVFAQTYSNWELLLVDDGSTDNSTDIACQYAKDFPTKVRYLEHEGHLNRGMSATRNLGIRNCQGKYITLLDADDIFLPQKLEQQLKIFELHPEAAMVCGATQNWFSWTGKPEDVVKDSIREICTQLDCLYRPSTLMTKFLQDKSVLVATCSVLIRRELIEEIDGFEESFRGMFEDQVFFAKIYLKAPVFVESGCWDRYRQHPNSTCNVALAKGQFHSSKPNPTHLAFLNWLENYMTKQNIKDAEVWQALREQKWPYQYPALYLLKRINKKLTYMIRNILRFIRQTVAGTTIHSN